MISSAKIELDPITNHSGRNQCRRSIEHLDGRRRVHHFLSVAAATLLREIYKVAVKVVTGRARASVTVLTTLQNNSYGYPYFHSLENTETASTPPELSMDS